MTKEDTRKLIAVMQAYVDGKQIQCTDDESENWIDVESPEWDPNYDYRVKPNLTYRPFLNAQECWQEMQRHKPFGWVKFIGTYSAVVAVSNVDVSVATVDGDVVVYPFVDVKEDHTFVDGTPFGIKEER